MAKILLHTPEGVRDIYGSEYRRKLAIENSITNVLNNYGYNMIQTPTFEFFDIFSKERGSVPSKNLYKFFDREGNTLVLRPDMTPSIARAASKYYTDVKVPVKLCYCGNTFINNSELQGKLKEFTQIGGELIGDDSVDADAEIIAMVVDSMLNAGLKEFQVEIGHVGFVNGILEDSGLTYEDEEELKLLIEQKNNFAVTQFLLNKNISEQTGDALLALPGMFGSVEVLEKARRMTNNENALNAIRRLEKLYNILEIYGFKKYVSFDLGMLSNFEYYTGIIFKTYTYGTGDTIVTGGRYDHLLEQFGKKASAVGFGIYLDELLIAMTRQKVDIEVPHGDMLIVYTEKFRKKAVDEAMELRSRGKTAELVLKSDLCDDKDYIEFAKNNGIAEIKFFR